MRKKLLQRERERKKREREHTLLELLNERHKMYDESRTIINRAETRKLHHESLVGEIYYTLKYFYYKNCIAKIYACL